MSTPRAPRSTSRLIRCAASLAWLATPYLVLQPGVIQAEPPATASASVGVSARPSGEPGEKPRSPAVIDVARFDLHLTLAAEGADICVILPENRADPDGCAGLDVQAMRQGAAKSADPAIGLALLRFEGWASVAVVTQSLGKPGVWTDRDMAEYVRGVRDSLRESTPDAVVSGAAPGAAYDKVDIHGHPAVRYFADMRVASGDPKAAVSRFVGYAVVTDGAILGMTFMGPPEHDADLRRIAESSMDTLRLRPPKPGARFGPDWYAVGYHSGQGVFALVPLVGLIVGLVVLARSRRKTPPRA